MADDKVYSRGDLIPPMYGDLEQALSDLDFIPIEGYVDFDEIAEPSNPDANKLRLWAEALGGFGQLHFKDSNGLDYQLGRDNIHTVRNNTGATITKGSCVYISGSTGAFPEVSLAKADSESTMPAMGVVVADISDNSFGQVMVQGDIQGIDTSAFSNGDILYVSEATAGVITATKPAGENHIQRIGIVVNSGVGNGVIAVLITTADQTDAEIETAYNNQVGAGVQSDITSPTSTIKRWAGNILKAAIEVLSINSLSEDTTPQLSGDLDGQDTYKISGVTSYDAVNEQGYKIGGVTVVHLKGTANYSIGAIMSAITTGIRNVATGQSSLASLQSGNSNFGGGYAALNSLTSGSQNMGIGPTVLFNLTTGSDNVGIGEGSFFNLGGASRRNIGIGKSSGGSQTSGDENILIGRGVNAPSTTGSFQVNIANALYSILVGGDRRVGIGETAPDVKLHIDGALTQNALSADPPDPDNGAMVIWMSDGTGSGDDGDIMRKITDSGGTTKTETVTDYSAI